MSHPRAQIRHAGPRNNDARDGGTGGYILVGVLAVMILVSAIVASTSYFVRSALDSAKATNGQLALDQLIHAGLELTAYRLFNDDPLATRPPLVRLRLRGGTVTCKILDEGAKIDLNGADPALIEAVFKSTGMGAGDIADVMRRVLAMRGPSRAKTSAAPGTTVPGTTVPGTTAPGATAQPPVATQPPGTAQPPGMTPKPTRGFQSVGELAAFPGVTSRDMELVAPLLTVYNPGGKINIVTASEEVLSVVPGLSDARVSEIVQKRDGATPEELKALMGNDSTSLTATAGPAFTVVIEASASSGQRKIARVVITKANGPDEPYFVLARWD